MIVSQLKTTRLDQVIVKEKLDKLYKKIGESHIKLVKIYHLSGSLFVVQFVRADENLKWRQLKLPKKRKKRGRTSRDWLHVVVYLIGRESDVSFLDQSQSKVKQNQSSTGLLSTLNWQLFHRNDLVLTFLCCLLEMDAFTSLFTAGYEDMDDTSSLFTGEEEKSGLYVFLF